MTTPDLDPEVRRLAHVADVVSNFYGPEHTATGYAKDRIARVGLRTEVAIIPTIPPDFGPEAA